jgi:hypothetical protein
VPQKPARDVKVLRLYYRIVTRPEARNLSHTAHRWLSAILFEWTGENNGVIEFARGKHGAPNGLGDRKVFERARDEVLKTGLVAITREGGRNLPTLYAITLIPYQATPPSLGGPQPPTTGKILRGSKPPTGQKTRGSQPPNWGSTTPKENDLHIKIARASDYGKEKCDSHTPTLVNSQCDDSANESRLQGQDAGSPKTDPSNSSMETS